eukprot:CAMPEP_0195077260 /NCGR_PEP_ID=MMETSP0448-20130528/19734_1 /TAXON_ID=66468 /ORGANISM="Heterocapsa triquestra, Strain CCMP 448" /LENGTH=34 /DNA_ID= /DNA_START= /DNA_END= /DNA_ORIENTATION=
MVGWLAQWHTTRRNVRGSKSTMGTGGTADARGPG